ncbi:MAG: tRNA(Met) cytidine acetyltransferase, partial [Gammaproteobacteria bacterium]
MLKPAKTGSSSCAAPGHRQLLVLCGERNWCLRQLARVLDAPVDLYFGAAPAGLAVRRNLPQAAARQLLGGETATLVFDAHGEFDADAFGAACGLLMGGGVFVLLTPDFAQWPGAPDRQKKNLAVYPHAPEQVSGRYLRRLISVIESDPFCQLARQGAADQLCLRIGSGKHPSLPAGSMTADQQRAVAAIARVALHPRKLPLVLVA